MLAFAGVCEAAHQVVIDPPVDVGGGLYSYTVHVDSDSSDIDYWMAAWDGRFTGPMNQVWLGGVVPSPTMDVAWLLGADVARDSHFLFRGSDFGHIVAPQETAEMLSVTGFPAAPLRAQEYLLAQIVVPAGQTVVLSSQQASFATAQYRLGTAVTCAILTGGNVSIVVNCVREAAADGDADPHTKRRLFTDLTVSGTQGEVPVWFAYAEVERLPGSKGFAVREIVAKTYGRQLDYRWEYGKLYTFLVGMDAPGFPAEGVMVGGIIPEPATLALLAGGMLAGLRRRR